MCAWKIREREIEREVQQKCSVGKIDHEIINVRVENEREREVKQKCSVGKIDHEIIVRVEN